ARWGVQEHFAERRSRYISNRDIDIDAFRVMLNSLHNKNLKEKAITLAEQWREEGREAEAERSIIDVLNIRFGRVPEGLSEKIRSEPSLAKLRDLLIHALKASSLEDFASHL
ncbi:MAG: hypothetical protein ORN83_01400, partial [Chthoniobacteraceae bacterium]|nr:hypothetical protein [Chthoniobacteraceae bacterium]